MRGDRSGPATPSKPTMRILCGFKSLLRSKREAEGAKMRVRRLSVGFQNRTRVAGRTLLWRLSLAVLSVQ